MQVNRIDCFCRKREVATIKAFDCLYIIIGVPFFFLNISTSRTFSITKSVLLLCLCLLACIELALLAVNDHHSASFKKKHIAYVITFVGYFTFSLLWGIVNGYPFSLPNDSDLIEHYIITPIAVLLIFEIFRSSFTRFQFLLSILKWIALVVSSGDLIAAIFILFGIKMPYPLSSIFMTASTVQSEAEMAIRVTNEASLMFLVPLFAVMVFDEKSSRKDRIIFAVITVCGTMYSLLSGRKMLEIVIFLSLAFCVVWQLFSRRVRVKNKVFVCVVVLVLIAVAFFLSDLLNIGNIFQIALTTLQNGFSSSSRGVYGRVDNMVALFDLWAQSPIIGNGLNSYVSSSLASSITPWSYEIVYNALLAQTGIIGIVILGVGMLYILSRLYKSYKKTFECFYLAFFIGFGCFLICGASNPLVYYVWVWAIVFVVSESESNYVELQRK